MAKKVQEINATSTADIAFLLLIFFLVTTTMNVDSGIQRMLPPLSEEQQEQAQDVNQRNLLLVFVSAQDAIMVGGERMDIHQLKDKVKNFVLNPDNDPELPEKEITQIDLVGEYPVSKGLVSLQNDRGTSYSTYIMVQNELTRAFNEIKEELSIRKFNKGFADLDEEQRKAITTAVPSKISEAEPRDIGGNK